MSNVNMVVLTGRLGTAPEEKKLPNGKTVTTFRLASNRWDHKTSAEVADWYTISVWEREAERCMKLLKVGASVLIEGRMSLKEWKDGEGKKHSRFEVVAQRVSLLAFARREGDKGDKQDKGDTGEKVSPGVPLSTHSHEFYSEAVPF